MPLAKAAREVSARLDEPRFQDGTEWGLAWLSLIMGVEMDRLSAWNWDQDTNLYGPDLIFPRGYDRVLESLANGLDIRYSEIVRRVEWDRTKVRLDTESNSFEAERLILTLPVGVLRSGLIEFDPPLPEWKIQAIRQLGMGLLNKVILHFPHSFWPRQFTHFGRFPRGTGHYMGFTDPFPEGYPAVLIAWAVGRFAEALEPMEDNRIVETALTELKKVFGQSIPEPQQAAVTRWGSDPFSRGGYSYVPVGISGEAYDRLAAPVSDRLFFAGEATYRVHPCTVHGAYLSGVREARRIQGIKSRENSTCLSD